MGKVKWNTSGADLDAQEPEDRETFEGYDGPQPPNNTVVRCRLRWARVATGPDAFESGNGGIRLLFVIDEPKGSPKSRYNNCPIFEQLVDTDSASFKIRQFLDAIGATGKDWDNTNATKDDAGHYVVQKFGRIKTDGLTFRVQTKRETYNDEPQTKIWRFLPLATSNGSDDADDDSDSGDETPF